MKIKLNIKGKKKLYQKINLPILAAFILSVIMAAVWIKMTYNTHIEYSKKIKERTEQNALLKLKSNKKEAEIKVIENKQYVDSSFLNTLYQKIEFLEKFTDVEKTAFLFFDGLEKAVTGEIFINNILSKDKNNEFDIEGISSNADNISELVKKLQANPIYSKVELVQITGGVKESKN
ncbi:MAG TPA: PilN domain-containing protein [Candidatus Wallbacteria bacterium]|nr:PilN domain-containing protein [Candidatus Wallbacteria bacterium]